MALVLNWRQLRRVRRVATHCSSQSGASFLLRVVFFPGTALEPMHHKTSGS